MKEEVKISFRFFKDRRFLFEREWRKWWTYKPIYKCVWCKTETREYKTIKTTSPCSLHTLMSSMFDKKTIFFTSTSYPWLITFITTTNPWPQRQQTTNPWPLAFQPVTTNNNNINPWPLSSLLKRYKQPAIWRRTFIREHKPQETFYHKQAHLKENMKLQETFYHKQAHLKHNKKHLKENRTWTFKRTEH